MIGSILAILAILAILSVRAPVFAAALAMSAVAFVVVGADPGR